MEYGKTFIKKICLTRLVVQIPLQDSLVPSYQGIYYFNVYKPKNIQITHENGNVVSVSIK